MPDLPLTGVRVLDLTRVLAGPTCTALLGDLGADVIKVEGLPDGDNARAWGPFAAGRGQYFASVNRNKRSLALSLRDPAGQAVLARLLAHCDVLVENFRPGTLAKLGLAPERLAADHPRLVVASISGYGPTGPERDTPGLDQIAQGMSGLMSVTGAGEHTPMRVGVPVVDSISGIVAALAVAAALARRERTGVGGHVQTSLLESAIAVLSFQAQRFLGAGEVPPASGNDHPVISPYGTFDTADDPINIAAGTPAQWVSLCTELGAEHLLQRAEYADGAARVVNRDALRHDLERALAGRGVAEWVTLLRAAGIPAGPVYRMDQVFADPQVEALGMVRQTPLPEGGETPLVRGPIWVDGVPAQVTSPPPELGEHSAQVLAELGYGDAEIADLHRRGVVHTPEDAARRRTG
ncbi:CaiB/BaiF CoA transferase family protein [Actinophytocola xanthii]|uniref:CoA transferase n=1 Tax=Actinophytocola xanthii TaxID=1912961 RepID=A0A1Q8CSL6_9PSEU|nr:CoA transferase [Actinophytocola xanthii]OLF17359.1 CoA transferase [Actinophytocola xanthii]